MNDQCFNCKIHKWCYRVEPEERREDCRGDSRDHGIATEDSIQLHPSECDGIRRTNTRR